MSRALTTVSMYPYANYWAVVGGRAETILINKVSSNFIAITLQFANNPGNVPPSTGNLTFETQFYTSRRNKHKVVKERVCVPANQQTQGFTYNADLSVKYVKVKVTSDKESDKGIPVNIVLESYVLEERQPAAASSTA